MTATRMESPSITPMRAIRRFDVFAEYTRQEQLHKGFPEDEAKGYGIWLAKVAAARRFGKKSDTDGSQRRRREAGENVEEPQFRSVGDELQTDQIFDHDVVDRMGVEFYEQVFAPAIAEKFAAGKSCEEIRDEIRKGWKPEEPGSKRKPAG